MIIEEIRKIKSTRSELRKFGVMMGIVLGLLGGLFLWRGRDYYPCFFVVSAAFSLLGFITPILLKPIHKIWMTLAILLGWLMTRVILSILFYLVVTPIGFMARLFGKNFLDLGFDKNADSYWIYKKEIDYEKKNYENQF